MATNRTSVLLGTIFSLIALFYRPLTTRLQVLGFGRMLHGLENIHGEGLQSIPNTYHAEDLHYHEPSGLLFSASEPDAERRWHWFPAMAILDDPSKCTDQGSLNIIYPGTREAQKLTLVNFDGPFVSHGIDIFSPQEYPDTVYIFAVNHLMNPSYDGPKGTEPIARSRIELFRHTIGTYTAEHLRSIWHPLIRTPNDILAIDERSFFVTNDHYYRSGKLRSAEVLLAGLAPWTDTTYVSLASLDTADDTTGVSTSIAIDNVHNHNGLGHGRTSEEVVVGRASAGVISLLKRNASDNRRLDLVEEIQMASCVDNPSYFRDPYSNQTGRDASGFVIVGLSTAFQWPDRYQNPIMVWLVQPVTGNQSAQRWNHTVIFQDDGKRVNSGSTAVIVPIDPKINAQKKEAWLWVTGPVSESIMVTRIKL